MDVIEEQKAKQREQRLKSEKDRQEQQLNNFINNNLTPPLTS